MSVTTETRFRCPGETYTIERPIHLARLAEGFALCRGCSHRFDTGLRPTRIGSTNGCVADSDSTPAESTSPSGQEIHPEGLLGVAHNEIDAQVVRRFAAALGATLRMLSAPEGRVPRVAVAADGRPLMAELLAAASDGLLLGGCRVVEAPAATAACLARLIHRHGLAGGLLVGNASGAPQIVSLKCWGLSACPWSAGGQLDRVTALFAAPPQRSCRHSGGLERCDLGAEYRLEFADLFHGLRPLRFVLDASSLPLAEHLRQLTASSACQILPQRQTSAGTLAQSPHRKGKAATTTHAARPTALTKAEAYRGRRVQRLCEQVPDDAADFGLWIDGDGDTLELIDERGRPVNAERLLLTFARQLASEAKKTGVVVESAASPAVRKGLAAVGVKTIASASSREAMFAAMRRSGAALGGGPSGRIWFGGELPISDALVAIGELLQLLSQSDRPLSEVLEGSG